MRRRELTFGTMPCRIEVDRHPEPDGGTGYVARLYVVERGSGAIRRIGDGDSRPVEFVRSTRDETTARAHAYLEARFGWARGVTSYPWTTPPVFPAGASHTRCECATWCGGHVRGWPSGCRGPRRCVSRTRYGMCNRQRVAAPVRGPRSWVRSRAERSCATAWRDTGLGSSLWSWRRTTGRASRHLSTHTARGKLKREAHSCPAAVRPLPWRWSARGTLERRSEQPVTAPMRMGLCLPKSQRLQLRGEVRQVRKERGSPYGRVCPQLSVRSDVRAATGISNRMRKRSLSSNDSREFGFVWMVNAVSWANIRGSVSSTRRAAAPAAGSGFCWKAGGEKGADFGFPRSGRWPLNRAAARSARQGSVHRARPRPLYRSRPRSRSRLRETRTSLGVEWAAHSAASGIARRPNFRSADSPRSVTSLAE